MFELSVNMMSLCSAYVLIDLSVSFLETKNTVIERKMKIQNVKETNSAFVMTPYAGLIVELAVVRHLTVQ